MGERQCLSYEFSWGTQGKNLGCWCFPKPCHVTVLVKLYQEIYEKPSGEKKKKN